MANIVCTMAQCQCSFGTSPGMFIPTAKPVLPESKTAATVMDNKPENFLPPTQPFNKCISPLNPVVIATLGAEQGPCEAQFSLPWLPGSPTVIVGGKPALGNTSKLICTKYGGVISIIMPASTKCIVPA